MYNTDPSNELFNLASDFIEKTNQPVFLTGKAGTGKTTFLKYIKNSRFKNTVVVAPTGVAAINAGGTTIHSFFGLPFSPFIPIQSRGFTQTADNMDKNGLIARLKINQEKREIMQAMELLVIDEISMVRCDVLDAIDLVLRHMRNNYGAAFGGVQVLYIGDMYQLPPVVKKDEWEILSNYYEGPYFFQSHICQQEKPIYIELEKIYRQTDEDFIFLLNQVRHNVLDAECMNLLNSRVSDKAREVDNIITLSTHNNKADAINDRALSNLFTPAKEYAAVIDGEFYENAYPADSKLLLKEGAQVMFLKNDPGKRYFNGKIGKVKALEPEMVTVICKDGDREEEIEVRRETWKTIRYSLNGQKNQVDEEEVGSFTQFPLRLAWAITIHKSQGLTFDHVIIDAESAFAAGQVYVALSRCTSLEGLRLKSPLSNRGLKNDESIVSFCAAQKKPGQYKNIMMLAQVSFLQETIRNIFDMADLGKSFKNMGAYGSQNLNGDKFLSWNALLQEKYLPLESVSRRFLLELDKFFLPDMLPSENPTLCERLDKAASWFLPQVKNLEDIFRKCPAITDNRLVANEFHDKSKIAWQLIQEKGNLLPLFSSTFTHDVIQTAKRNQKKTVLPFNIYGGRSTFVPDHIKHPGLYVNLKETRQQLSDKHNIAIYMVCSTKSLEELAEAMPVEKQHLQKISGFGASRIKRFGQAFLDQIALYMQDNDIEPVQTFIPVPVSAARKSTKSRIDTLALTLDLFKEGKSINEIAKARDLAVSTIEGHLSRLVAKGCLEVEQVIPGERLKKLRSVMGEGAPKSFGELASAIPDITYAEIRIVNASQRKD